jgi:F0F1-type ATP synthase assembly protein I
MRNEINLGLELAVAVGLGIILGLWLDSKLKTTPLLTILGVFLGAISGMLNIYRSVYPKDPKRKSHG